MPSVPTKKSAEIITTSEKVLLTGLLVLLLLAYHALFSWQTTADVIPDVVSAFFSVSGVPTQFLYVLVFGLLLIRRKDLAMAYRCQGEPWSAQLYLVPGVCLFLWGTFVNALDLVHVSLILVTVGVARFLSGRALTRLLLAPALILLLGTPLPAVLINQLIFPLQLVDTIHSVWLLNAIGIPTSAQGDMIVMAEGSTHFAESCTALGFSLWLTIFALAYVYIFRIRGWHSILLVLSAPLIAYLVNLLRAFTLVLNPAMEVLSIHTFQGVVFFLIGFSLLYATDVVLMRQFRHQNNQAGSCRTCASGEHRFRALLVMMSLLLLLTLAAYLMPRWQAPVAGVYARAVLPERIQEWSLNLVLPVKYNLLGSVRFSSSVHQSYLKGNDGVAVFMGLDDRLRRNRSLLSGKNAYHEAIGLVQEQSVIDPGAGMGHVNRVISDYGTQRLLTYSWYENTGSVLEEVLYAIFALDQSPFRREDLATVIRVTTNIELVPGGRAQAEKRLRTFLRDLQRTMGDDDAVSGRLSS